MFSLKSDIIHKHCKHCPFLFYSVNLMDGRFETSDPSMPMKIKPDGPKCKVCDDKASGYHYGVTSCEGSRVSCNGYKINIIRYEIIRWILCKLKSMLICPHWPLLQFWNNNALAWDISVCLSVCLSVWLTFQPWLVMEMQSSLWGISSNAESEEESE